MNLILDQASKPLIVTLDCSLVKGNGFPLTKRIA